MSDFFGFFRRFDANVGVEGDLAIAAGDFFFDAEAASVSAPIPVLATNSRIRCRNSPAAAGSSKAIPAKAAWSLARRMTWKLD